MTVTLKPDAEAPRADLALCDCLNGCNLWILKPGLENFETLSVALLRKIPR